MLHESVEEQDKPVEDVGQENLNKLPPETTENFANEPAVDICIRDTANIDVPTKKDPEDGRVAANDKFASSEGNTCGKKKESFLKKKARLEELKMIQRSLLFCSTTVLGWLVTSLL